MGRVAVRAAAVLALIGLARLARADVGVVALDAWGKGVDMKRSNVSIARTPPIRAADSLGAASSAPDPDAIRFVLGGRPDELPTGVRIVSSDATGIELDHLDIALADTICPIAAGPACRATPFVRAVVDDIDRTHPLVKDRSVRVAVGGVITVVAGARPLGAIRVGGPRMTAAGPMPRFRATLRLFVVREKAGSTTPFGGDEAGAGALARRQLELANALWGQCGISFGPPAEADVRFVDPPPVHLIALGCDAGLPASGGELRLRIDGRDVVTDLRPKTTPRAAARSLARAIEQAGFVALVSENARIEPGADRTADVLVRRRDGQFAVVERSGDGRLSTDPTMTACLGGVDLSDGLDHFVDVDAPAGTVEERALVKAYDDGNPSVIKVFMIPSFAGGGRIGESFIYADRSSVRNVVIEDRAGIRADRASFALAHELGHILLDMPGHPDDFGVDVPTQLMDSDAADPSAFGPRRLTLSDCARALRESGPGALVPMLSPWPLPLP